METKARYHLNALLCIISLSVFLTACSGSGGRTSLNSVTVQISGLQPGVQASLFNRNSAHSNVALATFSENGSSTYQAEFVKAGAYDFHIEVINNSEQLMVQKCDVNGGSGIAKGKTLKVDIVCETKLAFLGFSIASGHGLYVLDDDDDIELLSHVDGEEINYISATSQVNNKIFSAISIGDQENLKLLASDGTELGSYLVSEVPSVYDKLITKFSSFNNKLYFYAYDKNNKLGLWTSDGSSKGTKVIEDFSSFDDITPLGFWTFGERFITLLKSDDGYSLFSLDDENDGLNKISEFPGFNVATHINSALNGKLYISFFNNSGWQGTWESDGTSAGTKLMDVFDSSPNIYGLLFHDGYLYWVKTEYNSELHTYKYFLNVRDSATNEVTLLMEATRTTAEGYSVDPIDQFSLVDNKVYFINYSALPKSELWTTDGTVAGTKRAMELPEDLTDWFHDLTVIANKIYVKVKRGVNQLMTIIDAGKELNSVDRDGTLLGFMNGNLYLLDCGLMYKTDLKTKNNDGYFVSTSVSESIGKFCPELLD